MAGTVYEQAGSQWTMAKIKCLEKDHERIDLDSAERLLKSGSVIQRNYTYIDI
jgi:hypothetical protein